MWWELRSLTDGIRDEYRGWRKFKNATGKWPFWSILTGVISIPGLLALGAYCLVATLQTRRLVLIHSALFSVTVCGAIIWYVTRRAACMADVAKAKRTVELSSSIAELETFLR
jgi:hypothetical protein